MSEMRIEAATFREVLGNYPTGVCVITAMGAEAQPIGMVVGSFSSISLDPPLVGFFPGKNSQSWPLIAASGHFCVNVLASDQVALCRQIAAPGDKFKDVEYTLSHHGLPVLEGAMAAIECRVEQVIEAGDHWLVLGRVLGLEARRDADPMLFFRGAYGGFAKRD
ncbi:flavin reductase family protein [Novosphingobium flavum]|uniref:Flavin reductase family protein n=1 Tax=Novosphingobium flavum TaxID=1778672 RepID=A0A7X1KMG9_9SPHN|nr:flavin reductase family protein [Novosphingobium flavum]MBC2666627.1 flavin reductase family protein [Novosphingobium flavum]